jgi:tRNA dimethylallyltransferase
MPAEDRYLIVIAGPTAVGKTELAISMANFFSTEIISADSRQFYREMSIGTAKPDRDQLMRATHHFVDFLAVETTYTAGDFERDALLRLDDLFKSHRAVVLTGGSGLYIRALCQGFDKFPEIPATVREHIVTLYREHGLDHIREMLREADPQYSDAVDPGNPQRIIRALEVCLHTGLPYSSFRKGSNKKRNFKVIGIGLNMDRSLLYERINKRVDSMFAQGLAEEAAALYPRRHLNALQTVGYKEIFDHLDGKCSLEEAAEAIRQNTRRYAKRQLTWFHREELEWFHPTATDEIVSYIKQRMQE